MFHLKIKKNDKNINKNAIFESVKFYILTVKWQKEPHCHMLFWLESKTQPDEIDKIIVAEPLNKDENSVLYGIVTKIWYMRPVVKKI